MTTNDQVKVLREALRSIMNIADSNTEVWRIARDGYYSTERAATQPAGEAHQAALWRECLDLCFCMNDRVMVEFRRPEGDFESTAAEFQAAVEISLAAPISEDTGKVESNAVAQTMLNALRVAEDAVGTTEALHVVQDAISTAERAMRYMEGHDGGVVTVSVDSLQIIYDAMNHMGDQLNEMDVVEAEDEKVFPAFDLMRNLLAIPARAARTPASATQDDQCYDCGKFVGHEDWCPTSMDRESDGAPSARTPASVVSEEKGEAAGSIGVDPEFRRLAKAWGTWNAGLSDYAALVAYIDSRIAAAPERSGKAADEWTEADKAEQAYFDRWPDSPVPAGNSSAAPSEHSENIEQLMKFYSVSTLEELAEIQAKHVERLQAKLPAAAQSAFTRVREG